jgi:uncharacterized protein (TIGR03437 family)
MISNDEPLRAITLAFIAAMGAVQLGSQSANSSVMFNSVPAWGQDGPLSGYVYGLNSSQISLYLYEFIPDLGWYQMSNCGPIPIAGTGQFSINATPNLIDRNATRYSAYLVPSSLSVPCSLETASVPFLITRNAVASATLPRLPQEPTLSFGGFTWAVKSPPVQVYPGPQFYQQSNAFVDAAGQLHLRLSQCSGSWCAAEIYTKDVLGYGAYRFTINSQLNTIDPNVTFGLFPWDGQASDQSNREWDIEFGRWGNANAAANAQYVVQPYNAPNNLVQFLMSPATVSTHTVTWLPSQLSFSSSAGTPGAGGPLIYQWNFPGAASQIPTPGDGHLHMNLYVATGSSPSPPVAQEIVISGFQFTPLGSQIGLGRTSDNISFQPSSFLVPITGVGGGCSGTIESDSPWLSGPPNPVSSGGSLLYSVSENLGSPRLGNLILRSTNCDITTGSQVLSVSQGGLICTPVFANSASNIGFIQSIRSVLISGSAPVCSWTVSSSAPWLQITSSPSGIGDGQVQFMALANASPQLRQGFLALNNGIQHSVYQDGSGNFFAISPLLASPCGSRLAQFTVSWVASVNVELRLNAPGGTLVGQFGPSGSVALPQVSDGTLIYLVQAGSGGAEVIGSALASVGGADCTSPAIAAGGVVNAASYAAISVAPGSLATIFGSNLSASNAQAAPPFPTELANVGVSLSGEQCQLSFVSPGQINLLVPSDLAPGRYLLTTQTASADLIVTNVSPGIFTYTGNGTGSPIASVIAAMSDGTSTSLPISPGAAPIALPANITGLYIVLYGTGIRNFHSISANLGPSMAAVQFAGPQPQFPGVDQVNLQFSQFAGLTGTQTLTLVVDGVSSNAVTLQFQ